MALDLPSGTMGLSRIGCRITDSPCWLQLDSAISKVIEAFADDADLPLAPVNQARNVLHRPDFVQKGDDVLVLMPPTKFGTAGG